MADRRTSIAVVSVVVVLAAVMRIGSAWWRGILGSSFGFDESVYLLGAQHLWSGLLPYRDFMFVHPPGILIALTPVAWLAELTSDSTAMTAAKVTFSLAGAACAGLVAFLLLRFGRVAALFGGSLYAVWSAAVWGETMLMMGPLLNLNLLVGLVMLRRPSGVLAAGAVLGIAVTVKLWAIVPLLVAAAWVLTRYGRPRLMRFTAGALATAAVIVVPFLVAVPGRMYSDVVGFQSGRPRSETGLGERVFFFTGSLIGYERVPNALWWLLGIVGVVLVALPVVWALRGRVPALRWDEPVWWSVLALAQLVALAAAPSFYYHYTGFAAPALCLLAGYGLYVLRGRAMAAVSDARACRPHLHHIIGASAVLGLAVLALTTVRVISGGYAQPPGLAAAVADYDCVWMHDPAALIEADIASRQIELGCPMFVDRYATAIREVEASDADMSAALPAATEYQQAVIDQFRGSNVVLISERQLAELAPGTLAVLHADFVHIGDVNRYQQWERTY